MTTKKSRVFVKTPEEVLNDLSLTPKDLRLYLQMRKRYVFFTSLERDYYDTAEFLSETTGIDRKAIFASLKNLEKLGYIEREKIGGRKNRYKLFDCMIEDDIKQMKSDKDRLRRTAKHWEETDKIPF